MHLLLWSYMHEGEKCIIWSYCQGTLEMQREVVQTTAGLVLALWRRTSKLSLF